LGTEAPWPGAKATLERKMTALEKDRPRQDDVEVLCACNGDARDGGR